MKFVIYARRSSESEDRQTLSNQSQVFEMKELAKKEKLSIVKIFQESRSAKAPGRPVFNEMLEFIKKKKAQGILCWKIDRLARNSLDAGMVQWLLEKEIIQKIKTFERDYNPNDNVVMASIEFSMANQYIRDLSRNVKRGLNEKIRRGEYPGRVPIGYVRNYKTKKIDLDTEKYHFVKKAFQLYSTHNWSLQQISDLLFAEGLIAERKGKVGTTVLQRVLSNPIYYGYFKWNDLLHKGSHSPIVSKKLFDKVQRVLFPFQYKKNVQSQNFAFRGNLVCGECGLKITAEKHKGHIYYRCTKSRGADFCSQKYLREEKLIKEMEKWLDKIHFDEKTLDLIIQATKANFASEQSHKQYSKEKTTRRLKENQAKQDLLVDKFIEGCVPEEIYNRKLSFLRNEQARMETLLEETKIENQEVIEKIEMIVRFVKKAKILFQVGDQKTKKEIVALLASNIFIKDQKISKVVLDEPFIWLLEDVKNFSAQKTTFEPMLFALDKRKTASVEAGENGMLGDRDSNPN